MSLNEKETKTVLKNIDLTLKKLDNGDFKILFLVADSKGSPVGSLNYTYDVALTLKEMGYNVKMLYAENEYVGVGDWMGDKYSKLPHHNINRDNIDISPCDILFIPELFSGVMNKTKDLPCKKISILHNFSYLTELVPMGLTWTQLGVNECLTTSKTMGKRLNKFFPSIKTHTVRPKISEVFKKTDGRKLIVNIISKDENVINKIIKPFKWLYPIYNFVTFRYINGRSHEEESKFLSEGSITVWVDEDTDFGYSALEAMACGNIVIGRVPEHEPEWMQDEEGNIKDNCLWFYKLDDVYPLLANTIYSLLYEKMPKELYNNMNETVQEYTSKKHKEDMKKFIQDVLDDRKDELKKLSESLKKDNNK